MSKHPRKAAALKRGDLVKRSPPPRPYPIRLSDLPLAPVGPYWTEGLTPGNGEMWPVLSSPYSTSSIVIDHSGRLYRAR